MEKHNKNRPFACAVCEKRFAFKQGLERHEVVHLKNQPHKCQYCDLSFPSAGKLQRHVAKHAGNRPYPCKLCNKSFLLSHHLTRHVRAHQQEVDMTIFKCADCNRDYDDLNAFVEHVSVHAVESSFCPMCKQSVADLNDVEPHIRNHLTKKQHPCDYCDLMFQKAEQLDAHCMEQHGNELCAIIPIGDKLPGEDDVVEEYVVEELELKPLEPAATVKKENATDPSEDDADGQYYVVIESEHGESDTDSQPLPPAPKSRKVDNSSIQQALAKLSKGVTIKKGN